MTDELEDEPDREDDAFMEDVSEHEFTVTYRVKCTNATAESLQNAFGNCLNMFDEFLGNTDAEVIEEDDEPSPGDRHDPVCPGDYSGG